MESIKKCVFVLENGPLFCCATPMALFTTFEMLPSSFETQFGCFFSPFGGELCDGLACQLSFYDDEWWLPIRRTRPVRVGRLAIFMSFVDTRQAVTLATPLESSHGAWGHSGII